MGFTQLQFIEVNQRRYRGASQSDGSIWKDLAARHSRPCRDTMSLSRCRGVFASTFEDPVAWNPFWYAHPDADMGADPHGDRNLGTRFLTAADRIGGNGVLMIRTDLLDQPGDSAPLELLNTEPPGPSRPNYLHSVDLEFHFCSILTVIDPRGAKHYLRHVYWNVHWSGTFSGRTFEARSDHGFHIQNRHGHSGVPQDPRFAGVAGQSGLINCNAAACHGLHSQVTRQSRDWTLS